MANLKGFLRNHKQFTNEISFQQSRTSAFFFFLLLDVYFNQRMSEEHICKGAPGQDQLLLWLRSWRNASNYWAIELISVLEEKSHDLYLASNVVAIW